jgi:hypothetical protein
MNEVRAYHYTDKENVPTILRNGLLNRSKFNALGSRLRRHASYLLLSPPHDVMGYAEDGGHECLQVMIDAESSVVADMDLISAAYVNFVQEQTNESLYDYRTLVARYDATAVPLRDYRSGLFRAPEVIVRRHILPGKITLWHPSGEDCLLADNRALYNEYARKTFETNRDALLIAVNEDATGHIRTYKVKDRDEFFTVEESYVQ